MKKITVKLDFQFDAIQKDMNGKIEELLQANADLLKQFTAQKENLKIIASEALQIQEEFSKQQEHLKDLIEQNRIQDDEIRRLRNELEQYKNKLAQELFDKLKEIKELTDITFRLENERKRMLELINHL